MEGLWISRRAFVEKCRAVFMPIECQVFTQIFSQINRGDKKILNVVYHVVIALYKRSLHVAYAFRRTRLDAFGRRSSVSSMFNV